MAEDDSKPRFGTYVGKRDDYTCPGDHVTFEIVLREDCLGSLELTSKLGTSNGGSKPWLVEGNWIYDDDEEELVFTVTKDCAMGGPKLEREVKFAFEDGTLKFKSALYQKVQLDWTKPLPDPLVEKMAAMSVKELKEALAAANIDPSGCIERADFERVFRVAHDAGKLKLQKGAAQPVGTSSPAKPTAASAETPAAPPAAAAPAAAVTTAPAAAPAAAPPSAAIKAAVAPTEAPAVSPQTSAPSAASDEVAQITAAAESKVALGAFYTLEQLTDKHIWEKLDVKAAERETYLADDVFSNLFGVSKEDFAKQPKWKRDNAKKKHNLF